MLEAAEGERRQLESRLEEAESRQRLEQVERHKLELQVDVSKVEVDRLKEILARQEDRLQDQENRARWGLSLWSKTLLQCTLCLEF
jgi:uncharacterized protein (DUF1697 family)